MIDFLPDPSLRQPSATPLIPLLMAFYAQAVLAILPNTFFLKMFLQPVLMWQAWRCLADVNFAGWLAQSLGVEDAAQLNFFNSPIAMAICIIVLRSFEWTFIIKEPLRRYKPTMSQDDPKSAQACLTLSSVLLDASELLFNLRGIGWSYSSKSSPRRKAVPPSEPILSVFATLLFNFLVFDTTQYVMQLAGPTVHNNVSDGSSLFDPNLSPFPHYASAAFAGICGGVWAYSLVETMYRATTLIGRVVFRQSPSSWPTVSRRPWLSTSIDEYWSYRWHQVFRPVFVTFGARPGGELFGRPGAIMGAFAVSAVLHHISVWALGNGSEFSTVGGTFLMMGLGSNIELVFVKVTGMRVRGFLGWLWTMLWTLVWGTVMLDGWARHGMLGNFIPDRLRPGKAVVDAIIGLSKT